MNYTVHTAGAGFRTIALVAAFFFMLGINISLVGVVLRQDLVLSDHSHQLNAIYMMAPHLKPKEPTP